MRILHLIPISFPPRDAHEEISSTCAKIPTILSSFSLKKKVVKKKIVRSEEL
jgi:hypothetical protein